MASRTPEGKHTKRFIIEVRDEADKKWTRSIYQGFDRFFATREEAQAALDAVVSNHVAEGIGMQYHVRQK